MSLIISRLTQENVPGEGVLKGPGEMLVEYRVEVVVIGSRISVQMRSKSVLNKYDYSRVTNRRHGSKKFNMAQKLIQKNFIAEC